MKSFSRSQSLPYPQDYNTRGKNPILIGLLDQMKHDQELSKKYPSQTALLNGIISSLESERIHWPKGFNLMSSEQWIRKIKSDPIFYFHHARNSSEMKNFESILLDLAAQCLKREIQLVPLIEEDEILTFDSSKTSKTWFSRLKKIFVTVKPTLYFLSCQNLRQDNFFVSIRLK